ncbi:UDP-glucose--hexose-1-phosphate uridylyltransferase [Sporolactobacillus sp. Y61]|uniref:Galactose-1-phosphate uridylyltransferase n=1 Tax=Sporolactobacillus sp. Y61 TaxID=3160863 RepID=A0AAU8IIN6_9BACL
MDEKTLINQFVEKVIENSSFQEMDKVYLFNQVLSIVGLTDQDLDIADGDFLSLRDALVEAAVKSGQIEDLSGIREIIGAKLMNLITPPPSTVNQVFWDKYQEQGADEALSYFFNLSRNNDYIKVREIAKNIYFTVPTEYGEIEMTINLSKPEKDPKMIAKMKTLKVSGYPLCQLCMENEGYAGRLDFPARTNHRIVRCDLLDEKWGFQYSPYAYFNEHCIFLDEKHEPMIINQKTFERLLRIVQLFPSYFVGSNADLPIVGGSILTHEHYQGGKHCFAMEKAPIETKLCFTDYHDIKAGIVKWPMSVIRLQGDHSERLVSLAVKILNSWAHYSDEDVDVRAYSKGTKHHTVTPIARKRDGKFELDLVLRDNQTSSQYPDGIFHPHKDVQHIKKENIGLIEVMGLAILPPRLKKELHEVELYLLNKKNAINDYHVHWADAIKSRHQKINATNVHAIMQKELGDVFVEVLKDAGVFKRDEKGQHAFLRFAETVGLDEIQ